MSTTARSGSIQFSIFWGTSSKIFTPKNVFFFKTVEFRVNVVFVAYFFTGDAPTSDPVVCDSLVCDNDHCISESKLCDGMPDCADGKDEWQTLCGKSSLLYRVAQTGYMLVNIPLVKFSI